MSFVTREDLLVSGMLHLSIFLANSRLTLAGTHSRDLLYIDIDIVCVCTRLRISQIVI